MLAHVAKELQVAEAAHPVVVVHQNGRVRSAIEIQEAAELGLHAGDVRLQGVDRQQVSLFALAAGIADHAGGPADQCDGAMAGLLKSPQHHQGDQVADVQAVGRGVEAHVERSRAFHQQPRQIRVVGGLVDQTPPGQLGNDVRGD